MPSEKNAAQDVYVKHTAQYAYAAKTALPEALADAFALYLRLVSDDVIDMHTCDAESCPNGLIYEKQVKLPIPCPCAWRHYVSLMRRHFSM